MKIVHVSDYYEPETGGFLEESTRKLAERGHEVKVITSNVVHIYSKEHNAPPHGITVKRIPGRRVGSRVIYPGLVPVLLKEKADVIHAYGLGYFSGCAAGYVRLIKSTPLVLRADFNIYEKSLGMKRLFNIFWRKIPLNRADSVTVHINRMKEMLHSNYDIDLLKINILPHGIDFKKFDFGNKINRSDSDLEGKFVILNVSRADQSKNPLKIIEALPALKNVCKDFVFVHIGPYYDNAYFEMMNKTAKALGVADNVILKGKMPHSEIIRFYRAADVYVQSSIEESFCLATLEAMAAGLPVVATRTGAIGYEWFDNYDYWFSGPEELGRKLIELYSDKHKREELGQKLRDIAKGYDWEINIKKLENIYEKVRQ